MDGHIRTKERCPKCGGKFELAVVQMDIGLYCQRCHTTPRRVFIDLHKRGKRIKLYSDKRGVTFDSFRHAYRTLGSIRAEVDNGRFQVDDYVKRKQDDYLLRNYAPRWLEAISPGMKPATLEIKRIAVNTIVEHLGDEDIRDLRLMDCQRFLKDCGGTPSMTWVLAAGNEDLAAGNRIGAVVVFDRRCGQGAHVGAGFGFGEQHGAGPFASVHLL